MHEFEMFPRQWVGIAGLIRVACLIALSADDGKTLGPSCVVAR